MKINFPILIYTLLFLGSSLSVIVFLFYYFSNISKKSNILLYLIGKILQSITWLTFAIFPMDELPGYIITIPNSILLIGSAIEVYCIIRATKKEALQLKKQLSIITFFAIPFFFWFSYEDVYRIAIFSVAISIVYMILFVYATLKQKTSKILKVIGWMALVYSVGNIIRAGFTYYSDFEINLYSVVPIQVFTAFLYIAATFTFPLFYLFVLNEKSNFKLIKSRKQSAFITKELNKLIENSKATIFGIDTDGIINEWNHTTEQITKIRKEDAIGKNLVENYITEENREMVKNVLENALNGKEATNFEFPLLSKNNKKHLILSNFSTRKNTNGEIIGVLGIGQDITELTEYKEDLESKVKLRTQELEGLLETEKELGVLKTNFVSMASHEFRTPLAVINATVDVIQRYNDKLSKDEVDKRLNKIKSEVNGMIITLEDLLIIGKSDSKKFNLKPVKFNLIEEFKNLISEYQLSKYEYRNIIFHKPNTEIIVHADPKWIKHIGTNLLSNAIKYSESNKPVEIHVTSSKNEIAFSFKDYGIGISKEDMKHLFEPFHRGENVGNISGTGLGMVIIKKAVKLHGGTIDVTSEIGKGSTFTVTLPQ